jgi:glycosyltransferase involved in cell wall biosynthesis
MTKISVIIPVYNAGKYLHDTLQSVRQQSFTDWECICINDGSNDNSAEVIEGFVAGDKRFKLLEQENSGVSVARNKGLNSAVGEYVAFLDQDDLMTPTALETLFTLAEKYNVNMVRGRRCNIPENYKLKELDKIETNTKHKIISSVTVCEIKKLPRRWMYVWLCLFKKDFLDDVRFYEPLKSGAEDNIFMFEVFNKLQNFVQSRNVVCLHRKSLTSTMQNGLKLSHIHTIETASRRFKTLMDNNDHKISRYLYKRQMRNFFRSSVYKSLESKQFLAETCTMLQKIYPDIKPILKLKYRIISYFYLRNQFGVALFLKKIFL